MIHIRIFDRLIMKKLATGKAQSMRRCSDVITAQVDKMVPNILFLMHKRVTLQSVSANSQQCARVRGSSSPA